MSSPKDLKKIQQALEALAESVEAINKKVELGLSGQHANRVAKIAAAVQQYEQAMACEDPEMQRSLIQGAITGLNEGRAALFETLQQVLISGVREPKLSDLAWKYLPPFVDKRDVDYFEHIQEHEAYIRDSIRNLNRASAFIIRGYGELGEMRSALTAVEQFDEYCGLLEGMVFTKARFFSMDGPAPIPLLEADFRNARREASAVAQLEEHSDEAS